VLTTIAKIQEPYQRFDLIGHLKGQTSELGENSPLSFGEGQG